MAQQQAIAAQTVDPNVAAVGSQLQVLPMLHTKLAPALTLLLICPILSASGFRPSTQVMPHKQSAMGSVRCAAVAAEAGGAVLHADRSGQLDAKELQKALELGGLKFELR